MKKIVIACNICSIVAEDMVDKIYGIKFHSVPSEENAIVFTDGYNADIHICEVCLSGLGGLAKKHAEGNA